MSLENQNSVGNGTASVGNANGDNGLNPNDSNADKVNSKGSVSFDTYQKLLDQKKKQDRELEAFKANQENEKRKQLEEKEEFKKLYEDEKKRREEMENNYKSIKTERIDDFKISAFISALPSKLVKNEYLAHARLKEIVFNDETGEVDSTSVKRVVDDFVKNHSHLLYSGNKAEFPNDAPKPKGKLSYEDWLKLPSKEKQKRMSEIED